MENLGMSKITRTRVKMVILNGRKYEDKQTVKDT